MPVPASINDLSTTAGNNSPAGSESPTTTDDYLRAHASFIAGLRDSSAQIVKQTSVTDTTAGRLLLVGAFGWNGGNVTVMPSETDTKTLTTPGAYIIPSGGLDLPSGVPFPYILVFRHSSTDYIKQLAFNISGNSSSIRTRFNGTWSGWDAQYGTQNVSAFIQTLLDDADQSTARATLGLGTIATLVAKQAATAWASFSGTGTPSISDSHNVASITKNGTGDYSINFQVPMDNANYVLSGSNDATPASANTVNRLHAKALDSCRITVRGSGGGNIDAAVVGVSFLGGKA